MADSTETAENGSKRTALAGQWRTPPLPVFATSTSTSAVAAVAPPPATDDAIPLVAHLPNSTEDYAKALQEAYRRGAEAAAAMAAQGQALPTAVSCPNFSVGGPPQQQPQQQLAPKEVPMIPSQSTMPPPPPVAVAPYNNVMNVPTSATVPSSSVASAPPPVATRSQSMPDMTSYAAVQEQEKRQKRLARNRASARLRRLKKKNLVDAYETEVGILEKTLGQLSKHEWGAADNPVALTEALSMDRGQQALDIGERRQAAADILQQQTTFLEQLEELMLEQYLLHQLKSKTSGDSALMELKESLQLSDEQLDQLEACQTGWEEEWAALQSVKASLEALRTNDWLWNEGCAGIADQFMSILHKNQISKLMIWADHNAEAIDELDCVNAASSIPQGPVFHFGLDSAPEGLLDE